MMKLSRRALLGGSVAGLLSCASQAEAALNFFHKRTTIVGAINPIPSLTPPATYPSPYAGQGLIAQQLGLDMSLQGDGSYTAHVTAKPYLYDFITVPYGGTLEVTNACGNGDLSAVQCTTTFFCGAGGNFASAQSNLQTAATQVPFIGATGNRCMLSSPGLPNEAFADLLIYTKPARGYPDIHIIRVLFEGADEATKPKVYLSNATVTGNGHYAGSAGIIYTTASAATTNSNIIPVRSTTGITVGKPLLGSNGVVQAINGLNVQVSAPVSLSNGATLAVLTFDPTNIQTPVNNVHLASLYAATAGIRKVLGDGTTGVNPVAITTAVRSINLPTVYLENTSYLTLACSNLVPVTVLEQSGNPLVFGRITAEYNDNRAAGTWGWPISRAVDDGVTWLCCFPDVKGNIITTIGTWSAGGLVPPNDNINRTIIHRNSRKIDATADVSIYNAAEFNDTHWQSGIDAPEISFLGAFNMLAEARVANGGNLMCGVTFNNVGVDIISTTSGNYGELLHGASSFDQSHKEYDRYHVSFGLPIDTVYRDPYNEYTALSILPEPFPGVAKVQINSAGTVATIQTLVDDGTYSNPLPHQMYPYGANPGFSCCNLYFAPGSGGPLAGVTPSGLQGFQVTGAGPLPNSASRNGVTNVLTVSVAGLGLATTIGAANADANGYVQSGTFTYRSMINYANAQPYACESFLLTNAAQPNNIFKYTDANANNRNVQSPSYAPITTQLGDMSDSGSFCWMSCSAGPGLPFVPIASSGSPNPGLAHTPRVVIAGKTITGRGFANGGLTASGGAPASPATATKDNPTPPSTKLTLVVTQNAAGANQYMMQADGALPSSALFYWGVTVATADGQRFKVARNLNYGSANNGVQPGYSFFVTPIGSSVTAVAGLAWSFSDNMHAIFPNAQLIFPTKLTTSSSGGTTTLTVGVPLPAALAAAQTVTISGVTAIVFTIAAVNNTGSTDANGVPPYSFTASTPSTFTTDVITPATWNYTKGGVAYFGADPVNVIGGANGEVLTLDKAPSVGDQSVPVTFGQYLSATSAQINCNDLYHDAFGTPLPDAQTTSYGLGRGDLTTVSIAEHPDDGQFQGTTGIPYGKPVVNGFIRDRVASKGKQLQSFIGDYGGDRLGPGTIDIDANGQGTINPGTVTVSATPAAAAAPYACYNNNANYAPDFITGAANATSVPLLKLYKVLFSGWNTNFSSWVNGWGNIRVPILTCAADGTLVGKTLRLYAVSASGGAATAYLQDDLGVLANGMVLAIGDTVQQPINLTDDCCFSVGNKISSSATPATAAQAIIVKLDPNNPNRPIQHAPLTRFAGQTGLPWNVVPALARLLERSYAFTNYANTGASHGISGPPNPLGVGKYFAITDWAIIQSNWLGAFIGSEAFVGMWQLFARCRFIGCVISGDVSINQLAAGAQAIEGLDYYDCFSSGDPSMGRNANNNNVYGYIAELGQDQKITAIYPRTTSAATTTVPVSTMNKISTVRFPFNLDGTAAVVGQRPGALQPTIS